MNDKIELANAFMNLSIAADRVSRLLSQSSVNDFECKEILETFGNSSDTIDVHNYINWPSIDQPAQLVASIDSQLTVLEYTHHSPTSLQFSNQTDLITPNYKFTNQPSNIRIIHEKDVRQYDVGIINESLELVPDPAHILLMFKRCCKKIHIRFRPWTSRNGAFIAYTSYRAFVHLVTDIEHQVKFKAIRPLSNYESLLNRLGLTIEERHINTTQVDPFFAQDKDIMRVIQERTWGDIDTAQALRIMATDSVDFVVGTN